MTRRRLPIGIQTLRKIREDDCYYVDKTAYARRLVDEGSHYFLSRPRRFGKSLFLDTLKELFEGTESLFEGLAVHDRWDWSLRRPVLRLSFGGGVFGESGRLHANVMAQLDEVEREVGVASDYPSAPDRFRDLLAALHRRTGQRVAVLVDEYDKPILDALDVPDVARANRDLLRGLYAVIKDADAHVGFVFLTGVSKFSKVSLFSGLNNLTDITLDPRYSTGYLTITGTEDLGGKTLYRLGYPNREVRQSLNERLLRAVTPDATRQGAREIRLYELLRANDFAGLRALFEALFAGIPHDWHRKNEIARYEGWYASVFYSHFAALGLDVAVEDGSSRGRVDMALRFNGQVYLFELEVVELAPEGGAMAQLKARGYADKYRGLGQPIHLIGVEFSREARNIVGFEVERG